MEVVGWEFHILYFSVAGEDFHDMILGDIACQAANMYA